MYMPNDNTQNYAFCRLKLVIETLKYSMKINKTIKIAIRMLFGLTEKYDSQFSNQGLTILQLYNKILYF